MVEKSVSPASPKVGKSLFHLIRSIVCTPMYWGSLQVGDHKHRGGSIEDTAEGPAEGLRVKRRKALVEDDEGCILEERPGNVEAASFAVGELPTRLADQLQHPSRHSVKEVPEAELTADGFSLMQIFGLRGPAVTHQEVEGEGSREDIVLMELRRGHHLSPPARRA